MRLLIALLLASSVFAQTANVIELEPADTARAQKSWDALQKAQLDWASTQQFLSNRYTTVDENDPNASTLTTYVWRNDDPKITGKRHYRKGWEAGFEFSKDFKFIVPKVPEPPKQPPYQIFANPVGAIGNMDCSKGPC